MITEQDEDANAAKEYQQQIDFYHLAATALQSRLSQVERELHKRDVSVNQWVSTYVLAP
jgi:hypothetical protein